VVLAKRWFSLCQPVPHPRGIYFRTSGTGWALTWFCNPTKNLQTTGFMLARPSYTFCRPTVGWDQFYDQCACRGNQFYDWIWLNGLNERVLMTNDLHCLRTRCLREAMSGSWALSMSALSATCSNCLHMHCEPFAVGHQCQYMCLRRTRNKNNTKTLCSHLTKPAKIWSWSHVPAAGSRKGRLSWSWLTTLASWLEPPNNTSINGHPRYMHTLHNFLSQLQSV